MNFRSECIVTLPITQRTPPRIRKRWGHAINARIAKPGEKREDQNLHPLRRSLDLRDRRGLVGTIPCLRGEKNLVAESEIHPVSDYPKL